MVLNKYSDGRIDIWNKDVAIYLFPSGQIKYIYDHELGTWEFDLLSHVGEIWKNDVMEIIEWAEIKTEYKETDSDFFEIWVSHNISPYNIYLGQ